MKTILCTGWLLLALVAYNQSNPLPYVKEGKWSLIDTTGKVLLETGYSYIHPYDEAGLTFFRSNGAYGILDNSGKEVLPAVWSDVRQNGRGRYALSNGNGWISFASDSKHHLVPSDTLESLELLSLSWILAGKKGNLSVQNLASGQRWEIDDTASYYKVIHDHLLFRVNDTTELLVDPDGKELLRGFVRMENQNELYHACRGKIHYLFDEQGSWNIPDISSVSFDWKGVFVKAGKLGAYYGYDRSVIISGDYDNIRWFDEKYFLGTRAGFVSLIDQQTRKTALPFKYEDIKSLGEQGYIVYQSGYTGMIDPQFREVIPCKYTRFVPSGDLVRVYDESYEGLFSLKTHREILPAVYNRISWNGLRFKAQRNELMLLIELNEAHAVTQKASIDNAITVRTALGVVNLKRRKQIDYRLFSLGWYLDSTLVTPKTGDPFYTLKWGLKNDQDSILIQPSIPNLIYLPSSPFSIQSLGERPFGQGEDSRNTKAMAYRFIYLPKGKILSKEVFLSYDSTDFIHRSFIRVCTEKNFGVLREDGNYSPLTYIEKGNNTYLRYCQSEKIDMAKTNRTDMTEVPAFNFDGRYLENPIKHQFGNQRYYGLIYPEGKWNYLTPEGTPLFKDTFSFAQPFLGRHAIVQKGKTWGVVTADTLIIQPIYNSVERRVVARDTFFLVQLARGGTRLLDTNLRLLPEHRIADNRGSSLIIEENGQRYLTDNTFRKLTEGFTTMKFLKNGLILAKMHKEFTLFDPEGTMLYSGPEVPELVLFNEYPVVKNGATSDLLNTEGATLLTGFSSIETRGDFLLVKKEGEWSVYDHNVQLLADGITTTILVDSIGHHFCFEEKGRLSVYNENGERLARIKELKPDYFFSGRFIVSEKDSCFVYASDGKLLQAYPSLTSLKVLENGSILLRMKGKKRLNLLFDKNWSPLLPGENNFRELAVVGPTVYAWKNVTGKTILYNSGNERFDSTYTVTHGSFSSDRLLVKKPSGFQYITPELKPTTRATFKQATAYNGHFAAVGDANGWTLIDYNGNPMSYPNYRTISALTPGLFETGKLSLYGLFDSQGHERIPVQYEQIRFLPNGLIQCVKAGELFYFRTDGSPLTVSM